MSEEQDSASMQDSTSSGKLRKGILYGLLAIMLVALGYDYLVARPAVDAAYDNITEESRRINKLATEVLTNTAVAELLGKQPAERFNDGNDLVEVYKFTGGLPFKPHKLFTVYKQNGDQQLFYRHAKFIYETTNEVVPVYDHKEIPSAEPEDGQLSQSGGADYGDQEQSTADQTAEGGPGEGGAGGGPGGRRFDPEAMFSERDADGDGKLSGDEISDRMKENLSEIDKDGDGAVSKEELMQRMEERRAGFAGRGRGQDQQGERTPRRPPLEE